MSEVLGPPPHRMIISGPSGSGKGILTSEILLKHMRGKFKKIYYFSASALHDGNLKPLEEYCEKQLGQGKKDQCLYNVWDDSVVQHIIDRQSAVVDYMKQKGDKRKFHIAIICDDFANERRVVRGGILEKLFLMGRHINVSSYVLTQYYRLLSPALRTNAVLLACFKMRNIKDLESILEENSAIIPKDQLREMYERATSKPYGFLLLKLAESDPARTAYGSFETRLVPT